MWLQKLDDGSYGMDHTNAVHGVDYHKGLEDGRVCLRAHEYSTKNCQPVLYTDKQKEDFSKNGENSWVDYDSLTEREKFILGEPLFFGSSIFRQAGLKKLTSNEATR